MSSSSTFTYLEDFDKTDTGYTNKYLEERNDLRTYVPAKSHQMIEEATVDENLIYTTLKDREKTPVSEVFFSKKNVDYLQQMMKKMVYKETGHVIGRQSNEELLIIMRSIYLQHTKNWDRDISRQVAELNYHVLKYSVYSAILPNVKGYATYLRDNLRTNVVLPHAKYVNSKGTQINRGFSDLI